MKLDEDDFYDGEQEGDDEEDIQYVASEARVSAAEAEAELEKADWDVDVAIASLRRKTKARPKPEPKPEPKPKLEPKSESTAASANGKLSTLQMLAQKRAAGNRLADLAAKRATPNEPKTAGSALDKLRQLRLKKEAGGKTEIKEEVKPEPRVASRESSPQVARQWTPEVAYSLPPKPSQQPSLFGTVFTHMEHPHRTYTNCFETASSAKAAFSKPSPDDVVLNAQASAFKNEAKLKEAKSKSKSKEPVSKETTPIDSKAKDLKESKPKAKLQQSQTLVARLKALELKPSCAFVVIGHVDAGKSTLMGRLLLDSGAIPAKTVAKFEHESAKLGKSSFWLAWALDATTEERERGVTVDVGEARFETPQTRYTVLDAPGHQDYVPNMIAGVSQADVAVLVVDADTNAFESGLDGQTKEHAILARALGLATIVVAVNKMDTQHWDEARFDEIRDILLDFLTKKVGFAEEQCVFVPTSGMSGVNVVKRPEDTPELAWYTGETLVGALDKFARAQPRQTDDVLRFAVSNAFVEAFQSTTTLSGRVLSGGLEQGDVFENVQNGASVTVKTVPSEYLVAGDVGDIKVESEDSVLPGDVLAGANSGLQAATRFEAKIRLFDVVKPVLPGSKLAFHLGRIEETVKVVRIVSALGKPTAKKVRHLGKGSAAVVELELPKRTVLALPNVCKELGRFVLRLNGSTIGGGVVSNVYE